MASQYVEGPEAKGMETGFALDELLRKERGDNTRAMLNIAAQRQHQQTQIQAARAAAEQGHMYDLAKMAKGEEYKEQYAQKEADRGGAAISAMMQGQPGVARIFGYEPGRPAQIQRTGAMAEPEAAGIEAPVSPGVARRMPTQQEASGLARAVPGMAQALLQRQLDPNAGFTLGKDQIRFDAQGRPIAEGPRGEAAGGTYFPTYAEAEAARLKTAHPERTTITQHKEGFGLTQNVTESTVDSLPKWIATLNDPNASLKDRIIAGQNIEKYSQVVPDIAGKKALEVARKTPYAGEAKQRLEASNMAMQAAYRLQTYTKQEREEFTGIGKLGYEAARVAKEGGLPFPGYNAQQVARFSDFKTDNGMTEQIKFAIGGKQLTNGEQMVVNAFIPTGREFTTAEYEAKLRNLTKTMEAAQAVDFWLSNTAKEDVTPEAIRAMYVEQLNKRGIDVTKNAETNTQQNMKAGDRLRNKYLPGGGK